MSTQPINQVLADELVEQAIAHAAERKFNGDIDATRLALRQGRCDVCAHLVDSLVRQVGAYLGDMDQTVKAVYYFETELAALRPPAELRASANRKNGINLVAWVNRKSAALNMLNATLEETLRLSRSHLGCKNANPVCFTLDLQMVDDRDLQEQRGYGAIVNSAYAHTVQVWSREGAYAPARSPAALNEPGAASQGPAAPFDPDLAPEEALFEQAAAIENLPETERIGQEHRLRDLKVILIRKLISDQLAYISIAKEWFSIANLKDIWQRRIGLGKIGGKSAGMLLAARILSEVAGEDVRTCLQVPESYFIGSDVMYIFAAMNGLMHLNRQKYKPEEQIRAEYPQIVEQFQAGEFPPEVLDGLSAMLERIGPKPVIVRSSSQLEDNFGTSFAGKYDSHFCPNQGTPVENLLALTRAIARTYASTFKPEALLYRRSRGLQDYDERMAILIQEVQGEQFGRYFLPQAAGVAFSRNLYRWAPQIRREDGFARLVWGLGTRAVERIGNDYPRLIALSHPLLQPDDTCEAIRHYSQQFVDLIDLQENTIKTLPVHQVITPRYPALRYLAQLEQDGYFTTPRSRVMEEDIRHLAITYDEFLRRTAFAPLLSKILHLLEEHYQSAVDVEFTAHIPNLQDPPQASRPGVKISLLQCRPQSHLRQTSTTRNIQLPRELSHDAIVFASRYVVPQGSLIGVRHVLFIPPEAYLALPTPSARNEIGRLVGRLNAALQEKTFICVGPGRWGTNNPDLGVYVSYADICKAGALVELAGKELGLDPEPSLGTHFFQDLMEAQIYPVAICLDHEETIFNREFLYQSPNALRQWVDADTEQERCLRLIDVAAFRPGHHLNLLMDDDLRLPGSPTEGPSGYGLAVAYLAPDTTP